jgi:hypothetical protein
MFSYGKKYKINKEEDERKKLANHAS